MANTNLLEGWACPKCGHTDGFRIAGLVWLDATDDGTVLSDAPGRGDHEWDGNSPTECPECGYHGRQAEFDGVPESAIVRSKLAAAKRDPAVQAVRQDLDGQRIAELERRVGGLALAIENLRHHATVQPAASPEKVRDMLYDALEDAHRNVDSRTGQRVRGHL